MTKKWTALMVSAMLGVGLFVVTTAGTAGAVRGCRGQFRLVGAEATWAEAAAEARAMGGQLATINSAREQQCIEQVVEAQICARSRGVNSAMGLECLTEFWLGGSDARTEGVWRWVELRGRGTVFFTGNGGSGRQFTLWADGEPNDAGSGEDCLQLVRQGPTEFEWNDNACDREFSFVVEF